MRFLNYTNRLLFIFLIVLFVLSFRKTYHSNCELRGEFRLFPTPIQLNDIPQISDVPSAPPSTPTITVTPTSTPTIVEVNTEPKLYRWEEIDSTKHKKKIYTDYRAVTDKSSEQHKLLKHTFTDSRTGIRVIEDKYGDLRYCVALGSYWARNQIGLMVDFYMDNGFILKCVVCDVKQDKHTVGGQGKYGYIANDLIEFYVDTKAIGVVDWYADENGTLIPLSFPAGDVSFVGEEFSGGIKFILIYDELLSYEGE